MFNLPIFRLDTVPGCFVLPLQFWHSWNDDFPYEMKFDTTPASSTGRRLSRSHYMENTERHLSTSLMNCTARHLTSLSAGYYIRPPNGRASDTPACVHAQSGSLTYSSPKLRPSFDLGGSWLGCRRLHMTPDIYSPWPEGGFRSAGFLRGKEQLRIC